MIAPLPVSIDSAEARVVPAPVFDTTGRTSQDGLTIEFSNALGNEFGGSLGGTLPNVASFSVLVDTQPISLASVQYGPSCPTSCYWMELKLATQIRPGSVITVSYVAPTPNAAPTNSAIQNPDGLDAASFGPHSVQNDVVAASTPSAPTVEAGVESATITVASPGSFAATSFLVTASPGGATCTVAGRSGSCTITGLTAGSAYTFTTVGKRVGVYADSLPSAASAPITVLSTVPNTPGVPTVVAGEESATITVTAPTGGLTPTSYEVTASPGGAKCTVTGASGSCTISGLTAGTAYTFTTIAKVSTGDSAASTASASVTALTKTTTTTAPAVTTTTTTEPTTTTTLPAGYTPSWDKEPLTESETDANTVGIFPTTAPGLVIITDEVGFTLDKKNGIRPKIRMKSYAGKIKMTISSSYKVGAKTKKYKCTFAPFGTAKKIKTIKWRWYTPKKACVLPAPLVAAVRANKATLSASGKWSRQWLTTSKKARPNKSKIKPRTLRYTMKAKPAAVK
jgi:hypothetical protein